ncbi:Mur ligase family protein [Alicyclobacillus sp. TC]|uniref:Mur ligase family protein n=1 Tax=Alicyclobacillus sp. TC TaxID=2606450 RepID=UPI001EE4842A|nr:Mur ligase family protein [Alicyclobacillus sp. TC]
MTKINPVTEEQELQMIGLWIAKCISFILRWMGKSATSFPGKIALRLSPHLLDKLGSQLSRAIVITGTNGKTTTTRLLASMLKQEEPIATNAEGANLKQGILSALMEKTSWRGRLLVTTALLEIDEATLPQVASSLPIQLLVVTNIFRDQLDRYGELDTTLQKIREGAEQIQGTLLVNADDPLARFIGLHHKGQTLTYGFDNSMAREEDRQVMKDGAFCLECGHLLNYSGYFYGQLGVYNCPSCSFGRPDPDFVGSLDHHHLQIYNSQDQNKWTVPLPVKGLFNVDNVLAAVAAAHVCKLRIESMLKGLATYQAPTGRMQVFQTTPVSILNLIKNPAGCNGVLETICREGDAKVICLAINDEAADGRDVSWLWDADFELLANDESIVSIVTSGLRARDMAVRLKYAGYPVKQLYVETDFTTALDKTLELANNMSIPSAFVMTTYTLVHRAAELLKERSDTNVEGAYHRASVS